MQYVVKFTRENCDKLVADYPAKLSAIYGLAPKDNHENRRRHHNMLREIVSFLEGTFNIEKITEQELESYFDKLKHTSETLFRKWGFHFQRKG
ncbi:MAG: hypothetical protein GY804_02050 [Alphaproteobacteria bacterium]|nr:hypothetical protein [Alphaproteobacteria bacterium]